MKLMYLRRSLIIVIFLLTVVATSGGVWRYSYVQALEQLARRGLADLSLATDRLTGQLQLYQQLAVLMADHPTVFAVLRGHQKTHAEQLLLQAADKTAALDLFLVDANGIVVASANKTESNSIAHKVYFKRARQGALGEAHGVSFSTGQRAYYFAAPVFSREGQVEGALVVVANINKVETEWRGARPSVLFTDQSGEIFITNRSELLFWRQNAEGQFVDPNGALQEALQYTVGEHELWRTKWSPYVPSHALHLEQYLPVISMRAEALIDVEPARRLATLQSAVVAAVLLAFGALLFLATERRRTLSEANARLEGRVSERTQELSQTNETLRREVAERVAAEAALKKAQSDLVQAGKLSALGQMSAGISHELNQPLMAIQQYAENGSAFLDKGKPDVAAQNLQRVSGLAKRMARIIKNLRAFARQESEPVTRVELVQVVDTALELSEARMHQEQVIVEWSAPAESVYVMGGDVRLGQVLVNLISNAADAMGGLDDKRLTIAIRRAEGKVLLEVADTGPGLAEPEKIFDPFYSTKEVGASEGMGLGLSISYGLVQSFGGVIRGRNRPEGGAVFTVELSPAIPEDTA
ncbi:MAG: sensor histidine kinase [Thalassovita sp.]